MKLKTKLFRDRPNWNPIEKWMRPNGIQTLVLYNFSQIELLLSADARGNDWLRISTILDEHRKLILHIEIRRRRRSQSLESVEYVSVRARVWLCETTYWMNDWLADSSLVGRPKWALFVRRLDLIEREFNSQQTDTCKTGFPFRYPINCKQW